jgi:hypothetical protein
LYEGSPEVVYPVLKGCILTFRVLVCLWIRYSIRLELLRAEKNRRCSCTWPRHDGIGGGSERAAPLMRKLEVSGRPLAPASLLRVKYPRYHSIMRVGGLHDWSGRLEKREFCCTRGVAAKPSDRQLYLQCYRLCSFWCHGQLYTLDGPSRGFCTGNRKTVTAVPVRGRTA